MLLRTQKSQKSPLPPYAKIYCPVMKSLTIFCTISQSFSILNEGQWENLFHQQISSVLQRSPGEHKPIQPLRVFFKLFSLLLRERHCVTPVLVASDSCAKRLLYFDSLETLYYPTVILSQRILLLAGQNLLHLLMTIYLYLFLNSLVFAILKSLHSSCAASPQDSRTADCTTCCVAQEAFLFSL